MLKKIVSTTAVTFLLTTMISFIGVTTANATAPVIASTSTISSTQANPSISITTSASSLNSDFANWPIDFGTTGLTRSGMSTNNGDVTISFLGTATCGGTITVRANAGAYISPSQTLNSNTLSFVISSAGCVGTQITIARAPAAPSGGNLTSTSDVTFAVTNATVGSITWSPTATTFLADTAYSATITITRTSTNTFPAVSANGFTLTGAGSGGATDTSSAVTAGATTATVTIAFPNTGAGSLQACSSDLLSSSSTIKGVAITLGQSRPSDQFSDFYSPGPLRGSVTLTEAQASGTGTTSMTTTDGSPAYWLYIAPGINSFSHTSISGTSNQSSESVVNRRDFIVRVVPTTCSEQYYWLTINVGSSSSSTSSSAQSAAATAAAAAAAFGAGQKLAKSVGAQQNLYSAFLGNKPGSIEDFRSANINVTTAASLNRINAEILKLPTIDRTDFSKIKALAEKIEFDESFFNPVARPVAATYATYGVPGVTDRIVAKVNAQVLELPAAQRLDIKAIMEIAKAESFVDRVANTETRSSVSATLLISKGLMPADYPKKLSLIQGLGSYPEGSLNTMAKIEAAIKEQIAKAQAPRLRTAEIKAKIAARKK